MQFFNLQIENIGISLYDYLDRVLVYDGKLKILYKKDIDFKYRYSSLKDNYIIFCTFGNICVRYIFRIDKLQYYIHLVW